MLVNNKPFLNNVLNFQKGSLEIEAARATRERSTQNACPLWNRVCTF